MPQYLYYDTNSCDNGGFDADYTCKNCPEIEYGWIRGGALYRKSSPFADITNPVEWATKQAARNAIVFPLLTGNYDGGATEELPGYGDLETVPGLTTHIAEIFDPNYKDNWDFWEGKRHSSEWIFVFRTSSLMHDTKVVCSITPSAPVENNIKSRVQRKIRIKWAADPSPQPYDMPAGVFTQCQMPGN